MLFSRGAYMLYDEIYSEVEEKTRFTGELEPESFIKYCEIEVFGVSYNDLDENSDNSVKLGTVCGYLIKTVAASRLDEDVYNLYDDINAELEFVISALAQDDGPLSEDDFGFIKNHFHIEEVAIEDTDVFEYVLSALPNMLLAHYNIIPDIISYHPASLPYQESKADQLKKAIASEIAAEVINEYYEPDDTINYDDDHYQLVLSEEQQDIVMGKRNRDDVYPEQYKDKALWDKYEKAGFVEWDNTRVMYKNI